MYKEDRCSCQCQKYGMAEVPMQQWGDLYDWYTALCNGTIFQYAMSAQKLRFQAGGADDGDQSDQLCGE